MALNRDLWAEYKEEILGYKTFRYEDNGFIAFTIHGDECYIRDIHVVKEQRKTGLARKMAEDVEVYAKEKGCKFLTGTVHPGLQDEDSATVSALAMISVGFKIHSSEPNKVVFLRRIK